MNRTIKGMLWSTSTVSYILQNEVYTGTLFTARKVRYNAHNPSTYTLLVIGVVIIAIISIRKKQTLKKVVLLMKKQI